MEGGSWTESEPSSDGEAGAEGGPGEVSTFATGAEAAAVAVATEGRRAAWRDDSPRRRRPSPLVPSVDERPASAASAASAASEKVAENVAEKAAEKAALAGREDGAEKVAEARARYLAAWAGHPRSPAHGQGQGQQRDAPAGAWSAGAPCATPRSTSGGVCDAGVT